MTDIDTAPTRDDMLEHAAIRAHAAHYGLPGRTPEWLWLWQHTTTQNERARFRASSRAAVEVAEAWLDGRPLS